MLRILDGPAASAPTLCVRRAPLFLRLTRHRQTGAWDALDMLGDAPGADEELFAYRRVGAAGSVHIDFARGRGRSRSAWYATGDYRLVDPQPAQEVMADNDRWRDWCVEQHARGRGQGGQEKVE